METTARLDKELIGFGQEVDDARMNATLYEAKWFAQIEAQYG